MKRGLGGYCSLAKCGCQPRVGRPNDPVTGCGDLFEGFRGVRMGGDTCTQCQTVSTNLRRNMNIFLSFGNMNIRGDADTDAGR